MNVQKNINQEFLREAARVAYGSGFCEKTNGGRGNIGILKDPYGRERIVKFNTHGYEEGGPVTAKMQDVSNSLRKRLWEATRSVVGNDEEALEKIRNLLNVDNSGNSTSTSLLTRSIVAKVITEIGGQKLWDDALAEKSIKSYSSTGLETTFRAVYDETTGVGNDARRSRANWELDNAMKAVSAALSKRWGDKLTQFSVKIQETLQSLVTDDVRRRLADTEGGGQEIGEACQAFIRQNALRLVSVYVNQDDEFGEDAKRFVAAYLGLAPGVDATREIRGLGYMQNAQFLRTVQDELGRQAFIYLLGMINEHTAGAGTDKDPLRMPNGDGRPGEEGLRDVRIPCEKGGRRGRIEYAQCQVSAPLYEVLVAMSLLEGEQDDLAVDILASLVKHDGVRHQSLSKRHYKSVQNVQKEMLRQELMSVEDERNAIKAEMGEEDEDIDIWLNQEYNGEVAAPQEDSDPQENEEPVAQPKEMQDQEKIEVDKGENIQWCKILPDKTKVYTNAPNGWNGPQNQNNIPNVDLKNPFAE